MKYTILLTAMVITVLTGCTNFGPQTVTRDRFDYNKAIADSWKEQTLLNIVKLRYADMPLFVEVASVVSGYTFEGSVNLGGTVKSGDAITGDFLNLGTSGKYTDRPTITYAPITGAKFNESFMTPIPPEVILFLLESGWPPEVVFPIVVEAINGLRSHKAIGEQARTGDPGYYRAISLIEKIQASGYAHLRVVKGDEEKKTTVIMLYREAAPPEITEALAELDKLLGLRSHSQELKVSYGVIPETDQELAILSRSMLQIMIALSLEIDVPPEHIEEGMTIPSRIVHPAKGANAGKLINIHTSPDKPENSFVAVEYEDFWYWIEKRDFYSKRVFTFLMILFSLTESGGKQGLPLVTIPAG